jgi:hypothetical protein
MGSTWSRDDLDVNAVPIITIQDAISAFEWLVRHYYSWDAVTRLAKSEILDLRLSAWCQTHPDEFVKKLTDKGLILRWMETPVIMPEAKKNDVEYVSNLFLMCFPSIPRKGTNVFPQLTKLHDAISRAGFVQILLQLAKEHRGHSFRGDILQWIHIVREDGVDIFEKPPLKGQLPPEAKVLPDLTFFPVFILSGDLKFAMKVVSNSVEYAICFDSNDRSTEIPMLIFMFAGFTSFHCIQNATTKYLAFRSYYFGTVNPTGGRHSVPVHFGVD